jgi:hypothetical protein
VTGSTRRGRTRTAPVETAVQETATPPTPPHRRPAGRGALPDHPATMGQVTDHTDLKVSYCASPATQKAAQASPARHLITAHRDTAGSDPQRGSPSGVTKEFLGPMTRWAIFLAGAPGAFCHPGKAPPTRPFPTPPGPGPPVPVHAPAAHRHRRCPLRRRRSRPASHRANQQTVDHSSGRKVDGARQIRDRRAEDASCRV